ncbi:MAG: precorrin-3B C(17)-methyltransferase [Nitrospirae bacterium]|nr:MAG: precorrin-3B C(17)-methyltransferase [Nitrospirota bacterium]
MSIAIIYITNKGLCLAQKIKGFYPDAEMLKFNAETVENLWQDTKTFVFIMASGIVVRTIAPFIKNKRTDPAVIVLDETGNYAVSLLSGHSGGANKFTRELAGYLGAEAVITTASDTNNMPSIDIWAAENNLLIEDWDKLPQIAVRFLNDGTLRLYSEIDMPFPEGFLNVAPNSADLLITNKKSIKECGCRAKEQLYLRPKNLVVGIGCNSGTTIDEIESAVWEVAEENNLSFISVCAVATIDLKAKEPGLVGFAKKYGLPVHSFRADELNSVKGVKKSKTVFKATGAHAVSEPAALLFSGADSLLVKKQKRGNVTVAIAQLSGKQARLFRPGEVFVVGTGPGGIEHITPYAQNAIRKADAVVGYDTYLELIPQLLRGKEIHSTGMTKETERCRKAVELALEGKKVAVISGGDPGIYAMAGLTLEILKEKNAADLPVEIIPGISALNACASRLGAPLMHDFACISLSDRLTDWGLIEKRLESAAASDFVIVLYNPKSRGRVEHINVARDIIMKHRTPNTPVGIVKAAMRPDESIAITNLKDMLSHDIDMQTTVIIGNSKTLVWNNRIITPRGYESKLKQTR